MSRRHMIVTSLTGLDYYEPSWASGWIRGLWLPEPIVHRRGYGEPWQGDERRGWDVRTGCGRLIEAASWDIADGKNREETPSYGVVLPLRHALRFARPCRRCWP